MKDIENHVVVRWAPQWRELGRQLNIEEHQMNIIEHDHRNNCVECCSKMLSDWLEQSTSDHTTWEVLFSAIDKLPEDDIIGSSTDIQSTIIATSKYLRSQFNSNRFSTTEGDWCPYQPKHYTALALIHSRGKSPDAVVISVTQELAAAGNIAIASVSKKAKKCAKVTKNLSDIFAPNDGSTVNPKMILIEGAPGIGKTVLTKEIAFQWANNKLLAAKQILFLVFLRRCNTNTLTTIEDFVQYLVNTRNKVPLLSEYMFRTQGKDVVIILDGYDEMSEKDRKESFIAEIVSRNVFPECSLVITSRPTASSHLHNLVDRRVEIIGFTEEDRLDYIQTALEDEHDQVRALQEYLQSNPTINALCYIPLNMTILLCLAEEGVYNLPKTQTEMYQKFIKMTVRRFIQKVDEKNTIHIVSISELPYPHCKVFKELAQLAFEALQDDKIVFTLAEIRSTFPNLSVTQTNWNGLGLLKAAQYFNRLAGDEDVIFHFLHFSIQEYMAAYYISTLSDQKQIKLLQKTFWEHRYYNTWIMYAGITGATSFALKHFLSGNLTTFFTKWSSSFSISSKLLNNKVKCLHLFQCLKETKNKDVTSVIEKFFQHHKIDLSNQTLIPRDLNTIGFFLSRSVNKQWEAIDLSGCNIGVIGCNILCSKFSDKENRDIISVKRLNLSYNQLTFPCLTGLFDLFKSWHTSEVIITDEVLTSHTESITLFNAVEEAFMGCSIQGTLNLFLVGDFVCIKSLQHEKILEILSNVTALSSMYLMLCSWSLNVISTQQWHFTLARQKISKIHIVGIGISNKFILALRYCTELVDLFIYDSTLPNNIADEVQKILLISGNTSGVKLIISNSKIQGVVNACSLSNHLSPMEMLNLGTCIRSFDHVQIRQWKENMHIYDNENKFVLFSLVGHMCTSNCDCHLQIVLMEDNFLFASKAIMKNFAEKVSAIDKLKLFLNKCDLRQSNFSYNLFANCVMLCIIDSYFDVCSIKLLTASKVEELFLHGIIDSKESDLEMLTCIPDNFGSLVIVTNYLMIGHNPTAKQIALAFQLEPSITIWKLPNCRVTVDVFYLLTSWLTSVPNNWTELNFEGCNISNTEFEVFYEYLRCSNKVVTVKKLKINQICTSVLSKLVDIIMILQVKQCFVKVANRYFKNCLIMCLTKTLCFTKSQDTFYLSLITNGSESRFLFKANLSKTMLQNDILTEVYIINCHINISDQTLFCLDNLSGMLLCDNNISKTIVVKFYALFLYANQEILIYDPVVIDNDTIYSLISTSDVHHVNMGFALLTHNVLYGFNIEQHQLQVLQEARKWTFYKGKCNITCRESRKTIPKQRLTQVYFIGKEFQMLHTLHINIFLECITTINLFGIDNYQIDSEGADDIAEILSINYQIEELYLNNNDFQTYVTAKFANSLLNISALKRLSFKSNRFTDDMIDLVIGIISRNTQLELLDLSESNLRASKTFKIACALNNLKNLKVLKMANNKIDNNVAQMLACVLCQNVVLEELDLNGCGLEATGCMLICRALANVSTLTKLSLSNNYVTNEAVDDIEDILSHNTQLQQLELQVVNLQPDDCKYISEALYSTTSLLKLIIVNSNLTSDSANAIMAVLSQNTQLQELKLDGNLLKLRGIKAILQGLENTKTLVKLSIQDNHCTEDAAHDIASVISHNTGLQELNLQGNYLKSTGIIVIAKALQKISTLIKLNISDNYISDEAVYELGAVLYSNTQLQELNLNKSEFTAISGTLRITNAIKASRVKNLKVLKMAFCNVNFEAAEHIADILHCNVQINELDLSGNNLETESCVKICRRLQHVSMLTKLNLSNNSITDDAADKIALVLSCNAHLKELYINANCFRSSGIFKVTAALKSTSSLLKLYMGNNISNEAVHDIADLLSHNVQLQELELQINNLIQINCVKLSKALLYTSGLLKLILVNCNITGESADSIAGVLSHNTQLQELNLDGNLLNPIGIKKILRALGNISTLVKLSIQDNHCTDDVAHDIASVISHNTGLQELNLQGNDFKSKGVIVISKALQMNSLLHKLYINGDDIDKVAKDLVAVFSTNTQLQELNLNNSEFTVSGMSKFTSDMMTTKLTKLKVLSLAYCNIDIGNARNIGQILCCSVEVSELDVRGNNLQTAGCVKICKALKHFSMLTKLSLSNNNITDEAAGGIASVLCNNTLLKELYINGNRFTESGIGKMAAALINTSTLIKLYLGNNNISNEAVDDIANILSHNTKLQELELEIRVLQPNDCIKISKALQFSFRLLKLILTDCKISSDSADSIADVLSHNTLELNLDGNLLESGGIKTISEGLINTSTLLKLSIQDNHCTEDAAHDIASVISHNTGLQELNLQGNDFQSEGCTLIAKALQNLPTLIKLNMDGVCGKASDEVVSCLIKNTQLQELCLTNNNFSTVRMKKLTSSVTSLNLKVLKITNSVIAANVIARIIFCCVQLQELDLSGNFFEVIDFAVICHALRVVSSLTKLSLSNNNIKDESANDIKAVLSCNKNLKEFFFNGNCFKSSSINTFVKSLRNNSVLKKLYFGNNNINNKAVDHVAYILSQNTKLQELELQISNLLPNDWVKISNALQYSSLQTLIIINSDITSDSAANILSHNTQLQELNLNGNHLQSVGIKKISKALESTTTLIRLSIQDNHCTEDAAHDIASVISHNNGLQELNLQGNDLQTYGFIVIAKALQKVSTLIKLKIGDNGISDKAANSLINVLCSNNLLQEFSISKSEFTASGIEWIAGAMMISSANKLKLVNLKVVNMAFCSIGIQAAMHIASFLYHNKQLEELDLRGNNLQTAGCAAICQVLQHFSMLNKLFLSNNNITDEAAGGIASVLSNNTLLKELYINGNHFTESGIGKMAAALINTSTLIKLYLGNNNISNEAVDDIANILSHNTQLQELELQMNSSNMPHNDIWGKVFYSLLSTPRLLKLMLVSSNITSESANGLAAVLSLNVHLKELTLNRNHFTLVGTQLIMRGLQKNSSLVKLSIKDNHCTKRAAHDIASVISHNTRLQELNLQGNDLQSEGFIVIAASLQKISSLIALNISDNGICDAALNGLIATLVSNIQLQKLYYSRKNLFSTESAARIQKFYLKGRHHFV